MNNETAPKNYEAQKAHAMTAYRQKLGKAALEAADSGLYVKEDGTPGDLWEENYRHNQNIATIDDRINQNPPKPYNLPLQQPLPLPQATLATSIKLMIMI